MNSGEFVLQHWTLIKCPVLFFIKVDSFLRHSSRIDLFPPHRTLFIPLRKDEAHLGICRTLEEQFNQPQKHFQNNASDGHIKTG